MLYTFLFGPLKSFASLILYNQAYKCVNCFFERPKDIYTQTHTCRSVHTYIQYTCTHICCVCMCLWFPSDIFNLLIFLHPYHGLADASESHDKFTNIRTLAPLLWFHGCQLYCLLYLVGSNIISSVAPCPRRGC